MHGLGPNGGLTSRYEAPEEKLEAYYGLGRRESGALGTPVTGTVASMIVRAACSRCWRQGQPLRRSRVQDEVPHAAAVTLPEHPGDRISRCLREFHQPVIDRDYFMMLADRLC